MTGAEALVGLDVGGGESPRRHPRGALLGHVHREAESLAQAPFSIGHVTLGCALGYLDYRFDALGWRALAPRLAGWYAQTRARPSFQATEPIDG